MYQFHTRSLTVPCSLCGAIHPGRIHGYVSRSYRVRERLENTRIVIPVIICSRARDQEKQYTKRLLPDFLVPRSVIRLDHLMEAGALAPEERSSDRICEILGCIDSRTARRRLSDLNDAIRRASLRLACRRSTSPELGALPTSTPDTSRMVRLLVLYQAEEDAQYRAGSDAATLPSPAAILQAVMWQHSGKRPSSNVSHPNHPP